MNLEQEKDLKHRLSLMSKYYRSQLPDDVIVAYSNDLKDYPYKDVCLALNAYRKNPKNKFMPIPAMIIEIMDPTISDDGLAREAVARIQKAVRKFGHPNRIQAKEFIGEIGWSVVEKFGGWGFICENLGHRIDLNSFQAQAREVAKNEINYGSEKLNLALNSNTPKLLLLKA